MSSALPILYSFRRCPFAIRARLALKVSGQCCELREVLLREKPDSMLQASAKGTVPVLIGVDGSMLDESLDIMLWALNHKDPLGWLDPEVGSVDDMIALIAPTDAEFKYHLDRYKYSSRFENADAEFHREHASHYLVSLDAKLRKAPYLFGAQPSLADMAILPFVRQFANTDRSWFDSQNWPKLQVWLERLLASDLFVSVMDKYRQWRPGDLSVYFPEHQ